MTTEKKTAETSPRREQLVSPPAQRHWFASLALATGVAALVAAIVSLGWFGYQGTRAYLDSDGAVTSLRDESVSAAEQAILNITTIDPGDLAGWQRRAQETLTGDALSQADDESLKALEAQAAASSVTGTISSRITASGVTEIDRDEDKVSVLVFAISTSLNAKKEVVGQAPMTYLVTVVPADGRRKASVIAPLSGVPYAEVPAQSGQDSADEQEGGR